MAEQLALEDGQAGLTIPRFITDGAEITTSTSSNSAASLDTGLWYFWATENTRVRQGGAANSTSPMVPANTVFYVAIDATAGDSLHAILDSGSGMVYMGRVRP